MSADVLHVTFVCTGNICRSPMAEKIFADHLRRAGLDGRVRVSSAGTHAGTSAPRPIPRTDAVLQRHGYPTVTTPRSSVPSISTPISWWLWRPGTTGRSRISGVPTERRALLRSFDPDADGDSVPDPPYYGGLPEFELVREQIEAAIPGLLAWVRER